MPRRLQWFLIALLLGIIALQLTDRPRHPRPPHRAEMLQAGDVRVRAVRAGRGDTTFVLIHGFGEHLLTWRGVLDPLARDHRVLAFDVPGFGGSDKPTGPYTLEAMASRVGDFLARYTSPPVVLVGNSMGGAIAAEVALRYPERVQLLVLIAPAGLEVGLGPITQGMNRGRAATIGTWESIRAFITPLHDPEWLGETAAAASYDPATDPAFKSAISMILNEFDFSGIGERFRQIHQPTLLIWGRSDPVIPYDIAPRVAAMIPCHQLATLDRAMHRPQAERPDTVVALIRTFSANPSCSSAP
jgi:pimeloyl-ACP methyl ester carboxylesterase